VAIRRDDFPLPDVDEPLTAPYFAGAARGELVITYCDACAEYVWFPQARCPHCDGTLSWRAVSGRGTLFSWATVRRPFLPAFAEAVPFVTALVALEEDAAVRVVTYLVDAEPESLAADEPLRVTFRPLAFPTVPGRSVIVPMFERATATRAAGASPTETRS
jgi:uncharacterized OB-fold protein